MAKKPTKKTENEVKDAVTENTNLDQMLEEANQRSEEIYNKLLNEPTLKDLGELMVFSLQYIESDTESTMQVQALLYTVIDLLIEKQVFTQDEFNEKWELRFKQIHQAFAEAVTSAEQEIKDQE